MPELTTIPAAELAELRERLTRLARDKAQLQLMALLMSRLGELPGLEQTVEGMLKFVMEILGGLNVTLFYRIDEAIHCVDVQGRREVVTEIQDERVRKVLETREPVSEERDFGRTGMTTREFAKATTWVMPLLVGAELVGVLRVDDLPVAGRELQDEVQTFLRYASLVLKNEISRETRLRQAFDQVSRANRELWFSESLDRVNRAIQGTQDLGQMMSDVLDAALAVFECDRAFLLYPCDPQAPSYRVPMERTRPGFPGALAQGLELPVDAESARVLAAARAATGPVAFGSSSEPPLPAVLKDQLRVQSQLAMAVHPKRSEQPYLFGLHQCSSPRSWRPEEARLFQEIGRRLSDALTSLLTQDELRESEERYRTIFQNSPLGIFRSSFEGRFLAANPALARILGYHSPEAVIRDIEDIGRQTYADPEDRRRLVSEHSNLTGVTHHQTRHRRKDGSEFIANQYLQTARDARGRPLFLEGILEDITERVRAEDALRDERGLFVGGPTVVFKWRAQPGWPVEYVSPNVKDQFGYSAEDLTSGRVLFAALVHPDDLARVDAEVTAHSEQATFEQTYRIAHADGRYRWIHDFTTVIRGRDGAITHFHGYVLDVTERKQAELELARLNRALRLLSDSNQALIHASEEAGLLAEVCRSAVEVGGYRLAWVGVPEQDEARNVRCVAQAGDGSGYVGSAWGADGSVDDPGGRAILTGHRCIERGIRAGPALSSWREAARVHGFDSMIALPLLSEGRTLGALSIGSAEPEAFDASEVAILEELASDLAFGLDALRTRATRDRAEAALQASEEKYRTLIQKIQAAVVVHSADSRIVTCNPKAQELLGLTEEQLLGKAALDPDWHFFRSDGSVMPAAEYPVSRVLATGQALRSLTVGVHRPPRGDVWVLVNADPVLAERGAVAQVIVTFIDITQLKHLELEMRRSVAAIEQAAECIIITDASAVIQYVNPAFARVSGYTREEAVGQRLDAWSSGRHDQAFYESVWATLQGGETWRGHLFGRRRDGTEFEEDATLSPVRDESGRVAHYVAVKRDVTQEVALEAQLRQSQKMEAIGRLAGGIAHDFNNLLQALLSHAQLLRLAPERIEAEMAEMEAQIRRGAALTRQLLLFSRGQEARREPLDLNEVIATLGQLLRRLVRENVTLAVELTPGSLTVDADRGQLEQVLMNLVINATDAMPWGGRLSIRTGRQGAMATLAVEDTGCGIPEAIRSRIFEPLFTTKPVGLGTGLGLSLVRDIVSQHGGRIDLESREDVGTTFRVLLPLPVSVETSSKAPPAKPEACPVGHGERVLVVEDGVAARLGLKAILRSLHYEVTAVGNGGEASALPLEPAYDVLVCDVMLPDVDGIELVRGLRERWPRIGVILMSGYTEVDVLARAGSLGRLHFLEKPFDMEALARELRHTLSGN